jgi:hypothetical protein
VALSKIPNYLQDLIDSDAIGSSAITAAKIGSLPTGSVLQFKTYEYSHADTVSFASTSYSTGATVTLTPQSSTSTIVHSFMANTYYANNSAAQNGALDHRFRRDGNVLFAGANGDKAVQGKWTWYFNQSVYNADTYPVFNYHWFESAGTTSEITWIIEGRRYLAQSDSPNWFIFNAPTDANSASERWSGTWIIQEIAG